MIDAHQESHDHVPVYVKLAAVLGVVTAAEVGILYVALPPALMMTALYLLAALKFGFVVAIFMHLKYDNKLLTGIFFSGFVLALATMVALISLIDYQPSKRAINVKDTKQLLALSAGNPENGPAVFKSKGCVACHHITSIPEARGAVGPKLDGLGKIAATRISGKDALAYVKESIESPKAFVVPSYQPLMPDGLRASMTDQEYNDLVAFLVKL